MENKEAVYVEKIQELHEEFGGDIEKMLAHLILIQMVSTQTSQVESEAIGRILESLLALAVRVHSIGEKVDQIHTMYQVGGSKDDTRH